MAGLSKGQLVELLGLEDFDPICAQADAVRRETVGDTVHIRALLEISNHCRRLCTYCGLRAPRTSLPRYRMTPQEIVSAACEAAAVGYRTLVLQSGEDPWFTPRMLGQIISEIKARTGMAVTLGCGEMKGEDYAYLKEAGTDRYLIKHETADPDLYRRLHPDSTLEQRVGCLRTLKALGYETGSGFMVGLPGQTLETLAEDLLLLASIPCDMAGIGPFLPHPDTPLREGTAGSPELTRRCVALARLLLPTANLPATTALTLRGDNGQVFSGGANVVMRKITPNCYKKQYEIYPANLPDTDIPAQRQQLEEQIRSLGRVPL
ncbi:[FeFe] hydrogenase H-cluster radical SAM maturase HydE [Pseudoflavonifractor capillosus]|uniref:[FeFe] hydrogenase H-cluster radical SAM maturase HydE n=1 Tax=Pseudoflavonifractor capillosus TaxID=106588 RepID=UPI00195A8B17|nr:[FeFe] hydrogenase H-cluster radical SAM maturase HydE [Pseudoflavonifractor capillosus]MBM6897461.1 [FeFe] hydrogenase H-cluster radical SAM maturase HydE [Pseudoflavonifractor capillosus]